jgi:hypothetical protein
MTIARGVSFAAGILALGLAGPVRAQEAKKAPEEKKAAAAPEMPMPKPGPEHEVLKNDVGTWDATVEMMGPGAPPSISQGVETNTMVGGLWLVTDFKSEMMNQPFQGHGVSGYDPTKQKYVGTWVDSMSTGLTLGESTYDPKTKTMTGVMEGPDMSGKMMKMKEVTEWRDPDTRVFTMYMTGTDGKDAPAMRITYKRRK